MNEEEVNVVDEEEAEQEQENELTDDQSEQNENERTEESEDSEPETEDTNNEINETETNPSVDDFEFEYDRNETVLLLNEFEESSELIQPILDVTFTNIFPYLLPLFILFTVFIFSDQIIALIQNAIGSNGRRRR